MVFGRRILAVCRLSIWCFNTFYKLIAVNSEISKKSSLFKFFYNLLMSPLTWGKKWFLRTLNSGM